MSPSPNADDPAARLASLRRVLGEAGLDGFILPRGDEHLGEYVAPHAERLAWLTGFTGSAGLAIVLAGEAAIFSDGRYTLQLAQQTDPASWTRLHLVEDPPEAWLAERGGRIGYDPWLMSQDQLDRYARPGVELVPLAANPVDGIWHDQPAPPLEPAVPQKLEHAGRASEEKRASIAALLRAAGEDAAILTDPASIAWLLNIRGHDVPFTPLPLGFAILRADASLTLFMDGRKLPPETRQWLGNDVATEDPTQLPAAIARLAGQHVRLDTGGSAVWFAQRLEEAGARLHPGADPCLLPKARKNPVEQQGARDAHRRDGLALCRFLHWLSLHGETSSELRAAGQLDGFRARSDSYRGESFPAISASGPNGAIVHYRVSPDTDRPLRAGDSYLIDSGGQYPDGTTDVTRTVWIGDGSPPELLRDRVTRVLRGHIALATACFPAGITGTRLDSLARAPLWQAGLDYDHGTGHGIGSFLAVHEGPCGIHARPQKVSIEAGMILSDEPGYYAAGQYGIRLENLLLVCHAHLPATDRPFLCFETLTLVPFDRRLIQPAQLSRAEREWVDLYHARVEAELSPALEPPVRAWLAQACAPLAG